MSGESYIPVVALTEFPAQHVLSVELNGWRVLIARVGESFHAINDRCSHAASPLSTGRLRHGAMICPLHGARFDLISGNCIGGAYAAVRSFPVRIVEGSIEVAVPIVPPSSAEIPVMG